LSFVYGKYCDYDASIIVRCPFCNSEFVADSDEFGMEISSERTIIFIEVNCPNCGKLLKVTSS